MLHTCTKYVSNLFLYIMYIYEDCIRCDQFKQFFTLEDVNNHCRVGILGDSLSVSPSQYFGQIRSIKHIGKPALNFGSLTRSSFICTS